MTISGGNGENSPDEYLAKPGYGEVPGLPSDGAGHSSEITQSYWEIPGFTSATEQYPGYPPPTYTPASDHPVPFAQPVQYQPPAQYQPPVQYQPPAQFQQPVQYQQPLPYQQPMQYGAYGQYGGGYAPPVGTNGLAIAALVTSIAGGCTYGLGSVIGIILGVLALGQIKSTGQQGRGLAIAGIAVGAAMIAVLVAFFIIFLVVGSA
ncbi:DUF4190 domain-containing protein [Rhodococcus sp. OK302]|uniref:DUF4190 domain-containing protein n=1 Tax=Rhodococcus sp. OK302 TaxID=1882769 RepID=UPI000B93B500|nr:DUF4190 domain-containing protein [Rhodococcus sp. OK302]OYD67658.1 uncharacterized protein DUF4190 [Rhodococcus sp. OK302]